MTENYHTHTARCRHAWGTEREYIEAAIERGIKVLGFSDHSPQFFPGDFYSNYRMYPEQTDDYIRTLSSLREEYHRDIDIKIGLEAEYYPEIFDKLIRFLAPYELDYLILGQHYIDNEYDTDIYCLIPSRDEAAFERYVDQCIEAMATGKFTYIAHPDLFAFTGDDEIYNRHYKRLCEGAKKLGVPLEINFLGIAANRTYPSEKFFKIAAEVGNDIIFGADAHNPDQVCKPEIVEIARKFAGSLGITPIESLELKKI